MADWKDRLSGAAAAVASVAAVGTVAVQVAASNGERIAFNAQPCGAMSFGNAASMNATSNVFCQIASGQLYEERDYRGPIWALGEVAPVPVRTWTV